ncbi:citramalate synthase [Pleionea sp. CnH1-48]|uniref:citramalate synthase n=1 Tax=Pleionea sp. CnH1-48 TaxID=2954494 RepID=UPI0020982104|nr:citramalate synthase [Pleionea sp. CnH1-48]MCO7227172.1 citramalate synthase [Pleionea sp. CnH1-48]
MHTLPENLWLYDTTLRDGAQMQGVRFSAKDKLTVVQMLDDFGVHYIEAGWPGANPVDDEVYAALKNNPLKQAKLVAFGATCKPGSQASSDKQLAALLESEAPVITLVAKTSAFHIESILRTTREENLRMIADSVAFLKQHEREVWIDAEHFFDGYADDPQLTLDCLRAAVNTGADGVVLCDTNGGTLPNQVATLVQRVVKEFGIPVGIHAHNDCELAVANALSAYESGAAMIQGTMNGYGERCGNTNLISLIPTLQLKYKANLFAPEQLGRLTELSRSMAARANRTPDPFAPYVGQAAFAHKGGLHASAMSKSTASYEHIDPTLIGNDRHILVSNQAGRSNLLQKASAFGYDIQKPEEALAYVKQKEQHGFQFEEGDASLELLLRRRDPEHKAAFQVEELSVHSMTRDGGEGLHRASVKVNVNQQSLWSAAEGRGPVEAIDRALKSALGSFWPELEQCHLTDYKVRILDPDAATAATTHVWVEASYNGAVWNTIGCSPSIIEASQQALSDTLEYFILKRHELTCSSLMTTDRSSPATRDSQLALSNTQGDNNGHQAA